MYNLKDVMKMLDVPERTIRRHIKEGLLNGTKIGGVWKFSQEDLINYIGSTKIQKHIVDTGLKEISDYYFGFIEDQNAISYMFIMSFKKEESTKESVKVTKQFKSPFSLRGHGPYHKHIYSFIGTKEDLLTLIDWSEQYEG